MMLDWAVAFFAIWSGLQFRQWQRGPVGSEIAEGFISLQIPLWALGGSLLFSGMMLMFGTYEVANLYRMQFWARNLIKAALLWTTVILAGVGLFAPPLFAPRLGLLYCLLALFAFQGFFRLVALVFMIHPKRKREADARVIVVGWSEKTARLRQAMRDDPSAMAEIIGCVPMPGGRFGTKPPPDVPVLGDYSAIPALVDQCEANMIVLADDARCPAREIENLIRYTQREMIGFRMVPAYFSVLTASLWVEKTSGVPLLGIGRLPLERSINRVAKRAFDLVGAALGFFLTAPVVAVFCLIVYCESPGPVIFRQLRTSRSGRHFYIYKIRSMRVDAEAKSGAVWAKKDDPRRLRVGSFMRKWNIDELPQFVNVLKGEMSLVGPRPERPELIERFKEEIPNYNVRHEVLAGVTGWAQVNGLRGDTDLQKRIDADLYYLENWSLLLDCYCVIRTFIANKNAY